MKKIINAPEDVVADTLRGLAAAHPELRVDAKNGFVARGEAIRLGKIGLVSGGGSGHEPLHAGFVGYGMLDAACPGDVFTSPVPDQILAATKAADGGHGVLHIVKNYTGDVLNFRMAADLADDEDIAVATVVVDDDVAVEDSTHTAGRRGTGATVFVEKIAGALAEEGAGLDACAAIAAEVNERSASFGIALRAGTVPTAGRPGFELAEDEIEIGVGIHGEPGRRRGAMATARELTATAMESLHDAKPLDGRLLVLVNGMGGTPLSELYIAYAEVADWCARHNVTISRNLVGNYVTSLDMAGFSITVCRLTEDLMRLWDAPVRTPALRWGR
ncbi:MAG TPA: dihydroxyacetone kinase subunit DhaK [Streptosporangiaceae bacterium]|jgi:dihydroxyacetone kinase-like protein